MSRVLNLKKHINSIKASIEIMEKFQQDVQAILDKDYKNLNLKAINSYLRPYIHPQTTVCVFREKDWEFAKPNNIIFAIHVDEFECGRLKYIIDKRIKGYINE